ncbi:hypothetical protein GGR34_003309 [Microvirga flocculans]|uniref:Uncharacterized protein n=1 Tax=Microvirga flocculans TaxID=217168 RepID=A0A7W6IHK7_9HYPH|nr:hypothetical protein [Microvirga flocculans]MBB4041631.1 hypothetical protein [Microvirga flocculans]
MELARQELYARVWETPMSRLAAQYGITGNGLAKICDRLKVPYPPRGYWAKKAAGKKVVTYRLPAPDANTPKSVTIIPSPPPKKPPELPPDIKLKAEQARESTSQISVPERLVRPHPVIAGWLAEHDRKKQEARRERDPWRKSLLDPGEFSPSDQRKHRILNALFKELERHGAKIKEGERRTLYAELLGERVELQIREKQKQIRRSLTEREKRWHQPGDRDWKQELQPTGYLVFAIKTYLPNNLRTEWLETAEKRLESFLPDIIATLVAAGPLLVERRRQREEEERQRRIAEQKRYEEQQRKKQDDNRWRRFNGLAVQWREAEVARNFLNALKETDKDLGKEVGGLRLRDWITWAEQRLEQADPLNHGVEAIFEAIASVNDWTYRD